MSIFLTYRINSADVEVPTSNSTANGPLTVMQIDGNMKSISNGFEQVDREIARVDTEISRKANTYGPKFTGYLTIPVVHESQLNALPKSEGTVVGVKYRNLETDVDFTVLTIYADGKWQKIATEEGSSGFVSKFGDVMYGRLKGTTAEFGAGDFTTSLKTAPLGETTPDEELAEREDVKNTGLDRVTTKYWVLDNIEDKINTRIGSADGEVAADKIAADQLIVNGITNKDGLVVNQGHINVKQGNVYAKMLYGNLDLGVLPN